MADTLPTPITNQEHFLNGIAGNEDVTNIPAITNEEKFLKYIALNGGGGGTSPFYPAGNIAFASLPNPSADILGAMYNITDAFTTDSRFNEGSGVKYPAGTNVAVVNTGTEQSPVYKFDTYAGAYTVDDAFSAISENPVQNKVVKSALDAKADASVVNSALALKVDKVEGKGLSANDYTNADKSTVDNSPIASTTTGINPSISDSADGYVQGLTVYGRSEVVEGEIVSIGDSGSLNVQTCGKNWLDIGNSFDDWWRFANNGTWFVEPYNTSISPWVTGNVDPETGTIVVSTYDETGYGWAGREVKLRKNTTYKVNASASAGYLCITGFSSIGDNVAGEAIPISDSQFNTGNYEHIFFVFYPFDFNFVGIGIYLSNETDPTFEPYVSTTAAITTGIPLYAVGDVKDELDEKRGVIVKRCEKVVLTENEYWWLNPDDPVVHNSKSIMAPYLSIMPASNISQYEAVGICDKLTYNSQYNVISGGEYGVSLVGTRADIRINGITTVEDLKTYLASNPITIVYELAEPVEIPLTASELSALHNLRTYASTTNVTATDDPTSTVGYILNTANGQAVSAVQTDLQGQINTSPAWLTSIPENHKSIYRGKYLGNSVSAAQLAAIADGSFDDLYVGDYWTIPVTIDNVEQSVNWRIADMDYFIGYRDTVDTTKRMTTHHLVIVPDTSLYLSQPGSRTNGYNGSDIRTSGLDKAKTAINAVFPDMVLSHKNYISTAIDATGTVTRCEEQTCTIELMNQVMVFGFNRFQNLANLQEDINYSLGGQFALFRLSPKWKSNNAEEPIIPTSGATYLIQDPCYSANRQYWTAIWPTTYGAFNYSYNGGVRPYFIIGTR